jgi:acid phosphatase type 7
MSLLRSSFMAAMACSALLLTAGCAGFGSTEGGRAFRGVRGPVVVAVGDMACQPGASVTRNHCQDAATARLARKYHPRWVFALGDLQYDAGRLTEFRRVYAHSWGSSKSITKPIPGNHEYRTSGASGYFDYWRGRTRTPGYYAFDVDHRQWRVYALNSNCSYVSCAAEAHWLDRDMTRHPRRCSAMLMHHARYSSGEEHGDQTQVGPFWRIAIKHHADLALAAHDHIYERFQRMDAAGHPNPTGMTSFVSGTGGEELHGLRPRHTGSQASYNHRPGVLVLKLGSGSFAWMYKTIDGDTIDSGHADCRR